ncbi:tetratricopeptide repeat protein [Oceanospirillum sediminis]|uniref:Tetratricopeptide repeat protein n=1 Tax=Oceanospirillum sediminis TaxID=2760088 RepID=A0A839IM90_9GAMM|nr:tetratricopeptide repeat protein [Oceanospirillum sediminis]
MSISSLNHLLEKKRFDEALNVAESLLSLDSSQGLVWKAMGTIFQNLGRPTEALGAMEYAAELLPDDKSSQLSRIQALFRNDQYGRARLYCEHMTQRWSELPEPYEILGLIEELNQQPDRAESYFNKALTLDETRLSSRVGVARLAVIQGHLPEAELHYRKAFRLLLNYKHSSLTDIYVESAVDELLMPSTEQARIEGQESVLWKVLAQLSDQGIHGFATGSTLSGLLRNEKALLSVHHLSIAMPYQMLARATNLLMQDGWLKEQLPVTLINPRILRNPANGTVLWLYGLRINPEAGQVLGGVWIKGLPDHWQQITRFPFPVSVHQEESVAGTVWVLDDPESWLNAIFGDWNKPDAGFDTLVCARNQKGFALLTRCLAYQRVIAFRNEGNLERALAIAIRMRQAMPDDQLIREMVLFLYEESERAAMQGLVSPY